MSVWFYVQCPDSLDLTVVGHVLDQILLGFLVLLLIVTNFQLKEEKRLSEEKIVNFDMIYFSDINFLFMGLTLR
jgi:hypothetical protein